MTAMMLPRRQSLGWAGCVHGHHHIASFLRPRLHHQLYHVFRPVGVTPPVLIITYKTVRVNFMASILSLQGSRAAHKLS